jgi:hypothetical protein
VRWQDCSSFASLGLCVGFVRLENVLQCAVGCRVFASQLIVVRRSVGVADNGLQLGEVAEIEAQMFSFAQKFNRRTAVEFSTKPAILPNCCCAIVLFSVS